MMINEFENLVESLKKAFIGISSGNENQIVSPSQVPVTPEKKEVPIEEPEDQSGTETPSAPVEDPPINRPTSLAG